MKSWICLLAMAILLLGGCNAQPGEGEKIGQIVKVSKVGIMEETWEAQLIRGGMSDGSGAFGIKPFDFTIEDEALAKKTQMYMQKQTEVIIKYRTEGVYSPFRSSSEGNFLVSIEPAKK